MANSLQLAAQNPYASNDDSDDSLWKRLGSTALSGVAAIGNLLDTPGSMIRDTLALRNPLDNLINPFSGERRTTGRELARQYGLIGQDDTTANWWGGLGIEVATDPLTWTGVGGLLKAGTTGAGAGSRGLLKASVPFVKDSGVELFTGPAAQKVASGLGQIPELFSKPSKLAPALETVSESMPWNKGATALKEAGVGADEVRFVKPPDDLTKAMPIQTSPIPQGGEAAFREAAEIGQPQGSDWAKSAAEILTAPARTAAKLFNPEAMGQFSEAGQSLASKLHPAQQQAVKESRTILTGFQDDINSLPKALAESYGDDIFESLKKQNPELAKSSDNVASFLKSTAHSIARMTGEAGDDLASALTEHGLDPSKASPALTAQIGRLTKEMKATSKEIYRSYLEMGGHGKEMIEIAPDMAADFPGMEHLARRANPQPSSGGGFSGWLKSMVTRPDGSLAREDSIRFVPQKIVEGIAHDDAARGIFTTEQKAAFKAANIPEEQWAAKHIEQKYGKWLNKEKVAAVDEAGKPIEVPKWETAEKHAEAIAGWAKKPHGWPVYQNDLMATQAAYATGMHVAASNIKAIHNFVGDMLGESVDGMWRPLTPAVKGLPKGAKQLQGTLDLTKNLSGQNAVFLKDLYAGVAKMDATKAMAYLSKQTKIPMQDLEKMAVPLEVAKAIDGARKVLDNPTWIQDVARLTDIPTAWFKQNVTLPFASFLTRNLGSGQYMNAASGEIQSLADLREYGGLVKEAFDNWKGGKVTDAMEREWFTNGVLSGDIRFEGVQFREPEFGKVLPENPFGIRKSWQEAGESIADSPLDRVPGLRTARQSHGAVLETGAKANAMVEYLNRVPMYEYLKRRGMDPEQAAKRVLELQVDYSPQAFSPFENDVMRRVMPFYSYQRKVAPIILRTLIQRPTGVMGQTIRASRLASDDDPTMPSYIADTLAIPSPFGSKEEGGRSFVTGLGLPYEQPLGYFGGGLRGAGREFLSQLNPLIKAPLEWTVGSSFFQAGPNGTGRPLDELNPPIGQTLANIASVAGRDASRPVDLPDALEFAAANSPASRFISTARQLTDPRKGLPSKALNALTGVRIADVSPAAADTALFGRVSSLLKQSGAREFSTSYIPDEKMERLSPKHREQVEQLEELKRLIAERRKKRKNELQMAAK